MNLDSIPPHLPFLDALAEAWLAEAAGGDLLAAADGLIVLPTRRAARALEEAFLNAAGGHPLLLPRIAALGALDEAPLALEGALDLPAAVDPALRLAVLTRLVMALDGEFGAPATADRAWPLAGELAALLDEAARAEIDLASALPAAADAGFAAHWERTVKFLAIVTRAWPAWLAEQGMMDPVTRQVALLDRQAAFWSEQPPAHRVWVAGMTGAIPSVGRLLRVVAGLKRGRVILPGLDLDAPDPVWDALDDSHPQAGFRQLLAHLGATRGDVRPWPERASIVPPGRAPTLRRALLPAGNLGAWRAPASVDLSGLMLLSPADQQEEAVAIALVLREALEAPGARAALVTPDRDLAARVSAELLRFGVVADDSAGEPLAQTPPGAFLRLLAQAVANGLAPVPLLSLLKHPLTAAGLAPAACRAAARALELRCLRGPRPAPGLDGLRVALGDTDGPPRDLVDRLERCLAPVLHLAALPAAPPDAALAALIEAAEALAATDAESGAERLWSGEEGNALSAHLAALGGALPMLPAQPVATLPGLLDASMEGAVVRSRRVLRGRGGSEHPRIAIWGLLEARLQTVDVAVLGGLVEGVWPPATDPGPWMSRPMRAAVGLPSPEDRVAQMAHDFVQTACAAPRAILCRPTRRGGAPAVPARWLVRLEAMLRGGAATLETHPATTWARALDHPDGPPRPVRPPAPRPPVEVRPRKLSVTEIETWLRDPYAIHARHILRLRALDPIEESPDAADYGSVVHAGLHAFLSEAGTRWPPDARERLKRAMRRALEEAGMRPALVAWWRPRIDRIAEWVADQERDRRSAAPPLGIGTEIRGEWVFDCPSGPFMLTARADRIERRGDGTLAILDYKTGQPPAESAVEHGMAPQLPLEAAMAAAGAFGPDLAGEAAELTYWHLSGGFVPGRRLTLFKADAARVAEVVAVAREKVCSLAGAFDDPDKPYLSCPNPGEAPRFSDYAQLARVAEWAAAEEGA